MIKYQIQRLNSREIAIAVCGENESEVNQGMNSLFNHGLVGDRYDFQPLDLGKPESLQYAIIYSKTDRSADERLMDYCRSIASLEWDCERVITEPLAKKIEQKAIAIHGQILANSFQKVTNALGRYRIEPIKFLNPDTEVEIAFSVSPELQLA